MIASSYQVVDLGEEVKVFSLPVYTDNSTIKLKSKPDWLSVSNLAVGDVVSVSDDKYVFDIISSDGYFDPVYNDAIVFSDENNTETLTVSVLWNFNAGAVTLDGIADQMELMSDDTPIEGVNRKKILIALKNSLKQLSFSGFGRLERFETIRDAASRVFAPQDMVEAVRLYAVDNQGRLGIMYRDDNLNKGASSPIKDEDNSIVLDNNGYWIEGEGLTTQPSDQSTIGALAGISAPYDDSIDNSSIGGGYTNLSGLKGGIKSVYGNYTYIAKDKYFFVQDCPFDEFVLEYISDPILNAELKKDYGAMNVPKYWEEAIKAYAYYELINWKMNVPQSEKQRALLNAGRLRRVAKRMSVDYSALLQAAKTTRDINKR